MTPGNARGHCRAGQPESPFGEPSASSSSYGGFPLACRAVAVVTHVVQSHRLADRARVIGDALIARLRHELAEVALVNSVHGAGLAIGIALSINSKEELRQIFEKLVTAGVLVMTGGHTLRLYPPLTADENDLADAIDIVVSVLKHHKATK